MKNKEIEKLLLRAEHIIVDWKNITVYLTKQDDVDTLPTISRDVVLHLLKFRSKAMDLLKK